MKMFGVITIQCVGAVVAVLFLCAAMAADHRTMVHTCRIAPNVALCQFAWDAGGKRGAKAEIVREWREAGYPN